MVVIILFKTEFGDTQISVPKIGKSMPKAGYINPWPPLSTIPTASMTNSIRKFFGKPSDSCFCFS